MILELLIFGLGGLFLMVAIWAVKSITESLDNITAAVKGQVVKPVSLVPPSWGKRH